MHKKFILCLKPLRVSCGIEVTVFLHIAFALLKMRVHAFSKAAGQAPRFLMGGFLVIWNARSQVAATLAEHGSAT